MTLITRAYESVSLFRMDDYEQWCKRAAEAVRGAPGFQGAIIYNSLSYLNRFIRTTVWDNLDAMWTCVRGEQLRAFGAANPLEGLATPIQPSEVWDLRADVQGDTTQTPRFSYIVNWVIDQPGNVAAFEQSRAGLFEVAKQHEPGFIVSRLMRLLGTPNRYQVIHVRADDLTFTASPELQAFGAAHPPSTYTSTPPSLEAYRIALTFPAS